MDDAEDYEFDDDDYLVGQVDGEIPGTMEEVNPMIGFTWDLGSDHGVWFGGPENAIPGPV